MHESHLLLYLHFVEQLQEYIGSAWSMEREVKSSSFGAG